LSHDLKRRREPTGFPSVFGQIPGNLLEHSEIDVSSTHSPFFSKFTGGFILTGDVHAKRSFVVVVVVPVIVVVVVVELLLEL
jgi:hypothetical protein